MTRLAYNILVLIALASNEGLGMHMLAKAFADRIHSMDVDEGLDQIQTKIHLAYKHWRSLEVLAHMR